MMSALANRVMLSWGWSRRLLAFAAGAVGALAMPPFSVWPVLAMSFSVAVWLIDGARASTGRLQLGTWWAAAVTGWWFGFGYFLAGLWWLGAAFLVEADKFAILMPLGVVGLPAGLALFHALGFGLARLLWPQDQTRILSFAAAMTVVDWLRGHVLTGFPWNSFGLSLGSAPMTDQTAALVGLYGLTFIAVATLSTPALLGTQATDGRSIRPCALAATALAALVAYGAWRIPSGPTATVPKVALRIMQPNLPQDAKFRPENRDAIMARYLALSDRATSPSTSGVGSATHLIWPESPFPFILDRDRKALSDIAALLPVGVTLITGAARAEEPLPGERQARFYNALQVVDDDGVVRGSYDKTHLVPFGEYLPLRGLFDRLGIRQFVHIPGGFEPGKRHAGPMNIGGLPPVSPLICYEAIFPGAVVPPGARAGLLLNVTNDAWFGETIGPHQHLAQARMRAIEEGMPLVRAANSGISGIFDSYGRPVRTLGLGIEGVIDGPLPVATGPTLYARLGDSIPAMMVLFSLAVVLRRRRRAGRNPA
ncbi:MAG: apolipoprotein N-acyltransferase [Beijerinckiaceae bacterium]